MNNHFDFDARFNKKRTGTFFGKQYADMRSMPLTMKIRLDEQFNKPETTSDEIINLSRWVIDHAFGAGTFDEWIACDMTDEQCGLILQYIRCNYDMDKFTALQEELEKNLLTLQGLAHVKALTTDATGGLSSATSPNSTTSDLTETATT